jgi:hypothetical protein
MKSDRICWIDSRTIKRGHVLVLDGSLVPFCSKCLGACMRANDALSSFEKEQVRELTAQARTVRSIRADGPLHARGRSATVTEGLVEISCGWRTVRPTWADGPPL